MEHERWGTPVPSYVAGFAPDARPLDRGKPRDEDTEGGNQPADKSLINRRLSLHSQPCAAMPPFAHGCLAPAGAPGACSLDREHKSRMLVRKAGLVYLVAPFRKPRKVAAQSGVLRSASCRAWPMLRGANIANSAAAVRP